MIKVHNSTTLQIGLKFENPEYLSIGGSAELQMYIKEVTLFRSQRTLKPLDESSFKDGKPEYIGPLPPIQDDPVSAEKLQE